MQVKGSMSEAVDPIGPGASGLGAAKRMRDDNVGALPVGGLSGFRRTLVIGLR